MGAFELSSVPSSEGDELRSLLNRSDRVLDLTSGLFSVIDPFDGTPPMIADGMTMVKFSSSLMSSLTGLSRSIAAGNGSRGRGVFATGFFEVASERGPFLTLRPLKGLVFGGVEGSTFFAAILGRVGRMGAEDSDPIDMAVAGRVMTGRIGDVDDAAEPGRAIFAASRFCAMSSLIDGFAWRILVKGLKLEAVTVAEDLFPLPGLA